MPSGSQATYAWTFDGPGGPQPPLVDRVLEEAVTRKELHYNAEYDQSSTPVTDTWTYSAPMNYGTVMVITGPDGGVTRNYSDSSNVNSPFARVSYKTENLDGSMVERIWQENIPYLNPPMNSGVNPYVKTEFTSIKDAAGNLSQTAIKDYNYDKNGNVTQIKEYDWIAYSSAHPGGGGPAIPSGAQPKRITLNTFLNPTPDASDSSYNPNVYHHSTSPQSRNVIASSEVRDNTQTFSRTEFFYDNPTTTANLTQRKSWDSTKGAYSNPLSSSNSISVSALYNVYGGPTLTTDARGYQTELYYGLVDSFSDLYPTQVKTGYQTSMQRTETRVYDFSTGLVTSVTDVDNNVSISTTCDVFGRPTLVKAAQGKPEETRTRTTYDDTLRRVIVRSDLNAAGDEKLVTIQHFDQLGRIRLARQLEDVSTQSATDETTGIKVQTRYVISGSNSYQLSSNPYRASLSSSAGSEGSMGWTRTKSDHGRVIEVQTFGGNSLPAPWGANSLSTGIVTSAYDANFTTAADQAGKVRRSMVDGLGRLARVDEPDAGNSLGSTVSPSQPTSYSYNALGNLVTVSQGVETRTFNYDSLSRLTSAMNPESGTISYGYDSNGNLTQKTDARGVVANYLYDALNRNTSLSYLNDPSGTLPVTRVYDLAVNGKGRIYQSQTTGAAGALTTTDSYDALGRPLTERQQFFVSGTWGQSYTTQRSYNLAGGVATQTYPSGRTVSSTYDSAGRTISLAGNLGDSVQRTYASAMTYSALGGMTQEQFGTDTPIYHKLQYNVRGQLWDTRVGTAPSGNGDWNRGALQSFYDQALSYGDSGPDNNGNVLAAKHYRPMDESSSTWAISTDSYIYDELNRLKSVSESYVSTSQAETPQFKQSYLYDRYGNRRIDTNVSQTWGGVNNLGFELDPVTNNNRLYAPGDLALPEASRRMQYDLAGNLKTDTYSGAAMTREYDAENRMTSETQAGSIVVGSYIYNADGQRVRRTVNGTETWQIYGIGGELVAEYPVNGATTTPDKEYAYRNGQLLVTAEPLAQINWLVADQLGTPRIVIDKSGALANVKRHDYLPFGEELLAGTGNRTTALGYTGDSVRQKFTSKERDNETGLDYFLARYYSSTQGRFTSPDEFTGGPDELYVLGTGDETKQALPYAEITNPQSINKYQYAYNNPLRFVDPDGHQGVQKKSLMDQLLEYLGRMWKAQNPQDGMMPGSGDGERQKQEQNGPLDWDSSRLTAGATGTVGKGLDTYAEVLATIDPSGISSAAKGALEGDPTRVATALAGSVLHIGGASIAMREAKSLVGAWARDPVQGTISASIRYHAGEHGAEVGAKNVVQYLRKAAAFARNLKGAASHPVEGTTEGVTRYIKKGLYVDLDREGKIVSFGAVR